MALIRPLLLPLIGLSALGLILSLMVHLSALLGLALPLGERAWLLHVGIFVVWLPAVLVMQPLTREFKQKDLWRAALRGCPRWMRWMTYGFFAYAAVNFAIFVALAPTGEGRPKPRPSSSGASRVIGWPFTQRPWLSSTPHAMPRRATAGATAWQGTRSARSRTIARHAVNRSSKPRGPYERPDFALQRPAPVVDVGAAAERGR